MKLNLQTKLILPIIALVIIGMTIITIISFESSAKALENMVKEQLKSISQSVAKTFTIWSSRNKLDIQDWSKSAVIQNVLLDSSGPAKTIAQKWMDNLKNEYEFFEGLNVIDSKGLVIVSTTKDIAGKLNLSDRNYFKQSMNGELAVSDALKSRISETETFVISAPVKDERGNVMGVFTAPIDLQIFSREHIAPIRVFETGYAYMVNEKGIFIAHPDKTKILNEGINDYDFGKKIIQEKHGIFRYTYEGIDKFSAAAYEPNLGCIIVITATVDETMVSANNLKNLLIGAGITVSLLLGLGMWLLTKHFIVKPVLNIGKVVSRIQKGDLNVTLATGYDEIGQMGEAINAVVRELKIKADIALAISKGNLQQKIIIASDKDILGQALDTMIHSLNRIISDVRNAVEQVNIGSNQVADSSQALSQGATEQASSIEEITSSMSQIGAQTKTNADNASQANQLSDTAKSATKKGLDQMNTMITAMDAINRSSQEISKIIKTIDDIAFQTNLLALNAAVEAARAGKHGKGFAVVSQEVRNLAARSAEAAQETSELIEGAIKKIADGNAIAAQTGEALDKINGAIIKVADLINEISSSSNEQAQGIAQINQGLSQIESVTQQNTATAEETSATSEELSSQAALVKSLLSTFQLKTDVEFITTEKPQYSESHIQLEHSVI